MLKNPVRKTSRTRNTFSPTIAGTTLKDIDVSVFGMSQEKCCCAEIREIFKNSTREKRKVYFI
jgi:hypothetical protein